MKPDLENLNKPVENETIKAAPKVVKDIKPPVALRPGVDYSEMEVEITSDPYDAPVIDYNELLQRWGYDPKIYELIEPVKVSQWQVINEGQIQDLWSYKAGVRSKANTRDTNYADLVKEIKKHRKLSVDKLPDGESAFVVGLADWQIAKADGDGTLGTVQRILDMIDSVEERVRELRKIGRDLGTLIVAGLGDMIEGCDGNYSSQIFNVELNRREQIRVARRLIRDAICRWAKLFKKVIVLAVPGNHGENRKDGRSFTNPGDNDDVAVFEQVCEILAANPSAYGHVEFLIPENDTSVTIDICGTRIGFAHGHITKGGGTPQSRIRGWWSDQSFCNTTVGSAKILITGHYHHLSIIEYDKDKIHIQAPTVDGGSEWWQDITGERSKPGTLTFVLKDGKYDDLKVV
jgi:hypothetical protein